MKKTIKTITIVVISLLLLVASAAKAQIFLSEFDQGENPRVEAEEYSLIIGQQGVDMDQYVPIGDGWLLIVLCGAYLMGKRNRYREE